MQALEKSIIPIADQDNILPSLQHIRILRLSIYIFFYEGKRTIKLAKSDARILKKKLIISN